MYIRYFFKQVFVGQIFIYLDLQSSFEWKFSWYVTFTVFTDTVSLASGIQLSQLVFLFASKAGVVADWEGWKDKGCWKNY